MSINFFDVDLAYANDNKLKKEDVRAVVKWVHSQLHLPEINEAQAILFLQKWNYDKTAAQNGIDLYFTFKTFNLDYLNRNPLKSPLREALDVFCFLVLPKKTPRGDNIIFLKLLDFDQNHFDLDVQIKHFDMVVMSSLYQQGNSLDYVIVADMAGYPEWFIEQFQYSGKSAEKYFFYMEKAIPLRLREIHYFNVVPHYDENFFTTMSPFMKKELADAFHGYKTVDDFVKIIPRECLPADYGGSLESVAVLHEKTNNQLLSNSALFEWEDRQIVDEKRRPEGSTILNQVLAAVGSSANGDANHVNSEYVIDPKVKKITESTPRFADVETQYVKDKNLKREDVESLVEWAHNQPHLPDINKIQAILFLQRWQYQKELAKNAIDSYFTYKTFNSDLFLNRNPFSPGLKEAIETFLYTILPKTTPEGYRILFGKMIHEDIDNYNATIQLKHTDMIMMLDLYQEGSPNGYIGVIDLKMSPKIGAKFSLSDVKRFVHNVQEVAPLKFKKLYYFNSFPFMTQFMHLLKATFKGDSSNLLHIVENVEELSKYVPLECLPRDYGGSAESVAVLQEITKNKLYANAALFDWEDSQVVDESKRPDKFKTLKDILSTVNPPQNESVHHFDDRNLKKADVEEILDWVHHQPHLPDIKEIQAIRFLQRWHYDVESTKNAIDSYLTYKTFFRDLFLGRNPSSSPLRESLDIMSINILPKKTPEGYKIIYSKMLDVEHFDAKVQIKHLDVILMLDIYQEVGKDYILVGDMKDVHAEIYTDISSFRVKQLFFYLQALAPFQWKAIHLINVGPGFDHFLSLVEPNLTNELPIYIHKTFADLDKYVPIEYLPADYGGGAESAAVIHEKNKNKLLANYEFFDWEDTQIVDEKKRPEGSKIPNTVFTSFDFLQKGPSPVFMDVETQFAKDKNLKKEDVQSLINWAFEQPHLPEINEIQAILFLQRWQYQKELAKNAIDSYFTYKTFNSDLFLGRNPFGPDLRRAIDSVLYTILPKKTPEGYSILFGKLLDFDVEDFNATIQLKHADMIAMLNLYQEGSSNGFITVIDATVPFEIASKFSSADIKRYLHNIVTVAPLKFKGIYYFNSTPFISEFMTMVEASVSKEYLSLIHVCETVEDLAKFIPLECLPQDYGGSVEHTAVLQEITRNKLFENSTLFDWEDTQVVDESNRPDKFKNLKDILSTINSSQEVASFFADIDKEYIIDKNLIKENVIEIVKWVQNQPHLPEILEIQAIRFLQRWHHDVETAKSAIDSYFTYKTLCPDIFLNKNPLESSPNQTLNVLTLNALPKKTPEGYKILYGKMVDFNVDHFDFADQLKHQDMIMLLDLYEEGSPNGYIFVVDMKDVPSEVIARMYSFLLDRYLYYLQEVAPLQWKAFHFINVGSWILDLLSLMEPNLKKDLLEHLYVHKTVDDLTKYVPKECLPEDYGGSVESVAVLHEKNKNKLLANAGFFEWEDKQIVDETKRPDTYKALKDILAITVPWQNGPVSVVGKDVEYEKDKNLEKNVVKTIVDWIHNQPHLPDINETQAIRFLQRWYYDVETTKNAIDSYFTFKNVCPDLFLERNPLQSPLHEGLDFLSFDILPKKTPEGYKIIFMTLLDIDVDHFDYAVQLKHLDIVTSLDLHQVGSSNKYIIIKDMKGVSHELIAKLSPLLAKRFFYYLQEIAPMELKAIHFLNVGSWRNEFLSVIRPTLKDELLAHFYIHETLNDLTKHVPREYLPREYGGAAESVAVLHEKTKNNLLENVAFFEWEDSQKVDESKRPHQYKAIKDILAIVGSLQKEPVVSFNKYDSEYIKDKNLKKEDVEEVIDWVHTQPHLPDVKEIQVIRFLQRWYYDVEITKNAIDSYLTFRTFSADQFSDRNPLKSPLKEALDVLTFVVLPKKTPEGYKIIFVKLLDFDADHFDYGVQLKHLDISNLLDLYQDRSSKNYILISDMADIPRNVITKITPFYLKRYMHYLQEVAPLQWKAMHLVNMGSWINEFLELVKPTLNKKLLANLFVHKTVDDLTKYVPRECLPKDYGGSVDSVAVLNEKNKKKLLANAALFEWEDQQKVDESKRPDKYKAMKDILAVVEPFQNGNVSNGVNGLNGI